MYGQRKSLYDVELEQRTAHLRDLAKWRIIVADIMGLPENDQRVSMKINFYRENQVVVMGDKIFSFSVVKVPFRTDKNEGWDDKATHYQFQLWIDGSSKIVHTGYFSQGSAHKGFVEAKDILSCLIDDALMGADNFYDFCDNIGLTRDSLEAWSTYKTCMDLLEWFRKSGVYSSQLQQWREEIQES